MWATPPTNALSNEADIAKVQEWLSHASISTTPSRLQVKIAVDPAVAMPQIPSLMLQPIVENALKHGLGPKPGPGHLWITAEADGNQVRLRVEDDGVGTAIGVLKLNGSNGRSNGVGLENVARRLNALYQDQGRMTIEVRQAGGMRVTILLPRESGAARSSVDAQVKRS